MLNERLQVYLAGKVNGEKWQFAKNYKLHTIADYFSSDKMDTIEGKYWNHTPPAVCGLDWIRESGSGESYHPVMEYIIEQLHVCDLLLAYLDTSDAYGTIAEIAYVSALQKPSVVVFKAPIAGELLYYDQHGQRVYNADQLDPEYREKLARSDFGDPEELDIAKACPATDAYWLVSCFPHVHTFREEGSFNLNRIVLSTLKLHRVRGY